MCLNTLYLLQHTSLFEQSGATVTVFISTVQSLFLAEKVCKLQDFPQAIFSHHISLALQTTRTRFVSHQTHTGRFRPLDVHEGHCIKIHQHTRTNTRVVSYQTLQGRFRPWQYTRVTANQLQRVPGKRVFTWRLQRVDSLHTTEQNQSGYNLFTTLIPSLSSKGVL